MNQQLLEVKRERFHLLNPHIYLLQGTFPKEYEVEAYLDSVRIEARMEDWEPTSAMERFKEWELLNGRKVTVSVELPGNLREFRKLKIQAVLEGDRQTWFTVSVKELLARQGKPQYYMEEERVKCPGKNLPAAGLGGGCPESGSEGFQRAEESRPL